MSQAPKDLIDGIRQAESIQVAAIDVLRDLTSLAVCWVPPLDRAVAGGFGTVTSLVRWQYDIGIRAVEAVAPLVPIG